MRKLKNWKSQILTARRSKTQLTQKDTTQLNDNWTCRPRLGVMEMKKPAVSGRTLQVYLKLKFDKVAAAIKI